MTTIPGVIADAGWQPGDDLYERHSYTLYLFNFRDDPTSEDCGCGDAASWPDEPIISRRIPDDPWENFLAWWRSLGETGSAESLPVALLCLLGGVCLIVAGVRW